MNAGSECIGRVVDWIHGYKTGDYHIVGDPKNGVVIPAHGNLVVWVDEISDGVYHRLVITRNLSCECKPNKLLRIVTEKLTRRGIELPQAVCFCTEVGVESLWVVHGVFV